MNHSTLIRALSIAAALAAGTVHATDQPAVAVLDSEEIGIELTTNVAASGGVRLKSPGLKYPEIRSYELALSLKGTVAHPFSGELSLGLDIRRTSFRMDKGSWQLPMPDRFHSLSVELSYQKQFNERWTGVFSAAPGWRLAGSTDLGSKGFGTVISALGICTVSPTLKLAVGAGGDTLAKGSSRFVPALGLDWEFAPHWRLALGVPRTGLFYAFSEALELGVIGEASWSTYHVAQDARFTAAAGYRLKDTKLECTEARVGFQVNWRVSPGGSLYLTAGVIGSRNFEYPDRNLKLKTAGVDGGYASAGFAFQF